MDWSTLFIILWILCFIDDNAVVELRLLFHALTKAASHLFLALLALLRAVTNFVNCTRHWWNEDDDHPLGLCFMEGMCVVCEIVLNLMGALIGVVSAVSHLMQAGFHILAATLRTIQVKIVTTCHQREPWW